MIVKYWNNNYQNHRYYRAPHDQNNSIMPYITKMTDILALDLTLINVIGIDGQIE